MASAFLDDSDDVSKAASAYDDVIKVAVIGPEGVGKSCLVQRALEGTYGSETILPTVGVDFRLHSLLVDGVQTRMHVWDTTGNPRFSKITHAYYRVAQGILVVYDISHPNALEQVQGWLDQIRAYASDSVAVVLCGTKLDLVAEEDRRRVCSRANELAARAGIPHVQTSSKDGRGVKAAFEAMAREVRAAAASQRGATAQGSTMSSKTMSALQVYCSLPEGCSCMPWAWACGGTSDRVGLPNAA